MKTIREIVEAHTKEGITDWDNADKSYQETINGIVVKETAKTAEKVKADTIEAIGIESVKAPEDVKKFMATLQKTLEERESEYAIAQENLAKANKTATSLERESGLIKMGVTDQDVIDFIMFNVDKRVDDKTDWNTALETYKTDKPTLFENRAIGTTGSHVGKGATEEKMGYEKYLEDKYPDFKEN